MKLNWGLNKICYLSLPLTCCHHETENNWVLFSKSGVVSKRKYVLCFVVLWFQLLLIFYNKSGESLWVSLLAGAQYQQYLLWKPTFTHLKFLLVIITLTDLRLPQRWRGCCRANSADVFQLSELLLERSVAYPAIGFNNGFSRGIYYLISFHAWLCSLYLRLIILKLMILELRASVAVLSKSLKQIVFTEIITKLLR